MRELVESILTGNNVEAHRLFEARLNDIREKKLYEAKRNLAAQMNEVLDGKTRAQAEKEIRARGMIPRKASDVYGDPRDIKLSSGLRDDEPKKSRRKAAPDSISKKGSSGYEMLQAIADVKAKKQAAADRDQRFIQRASKSPRAIARMSAVAAKQAGKSIKSGHDVWMGKKEPTTLKGKGIALVRDILSHPGE